MNFKNPGMMRILWIATLMFCVGLVTNTAPWLRGGFGWVWPYALPRWGWLIPCAAGVIVYCVGVYRLLQERSGRSRRLMLWVFVWSVLLPLLLITLEGSPLSVLFMRTASTLTGGYEYASTLIGTSPSYGTLRDTLINWPAFVTDYRAQTSMFSGVALDPPGLISFFYAAQRVFAAFPAAADTFGTLLRPLECQNLVMTTWTNSQYAVAWLEMAMPLWAALAIIPLYRFGRSLFGERTARIALAFWPLLPGMALFTPRFNALYPLITLSLLIFVWRGITHRRAWPLLVGGFIVSVSTFLNFSLIPLGLLIGLWIVFSTPRDAQRSRLAWALTLRRLIYFGIGSASVWAIYWALSGVSVFEIADLSLSAHLRLDRPYLPWLVLHPYDMFLFVGLPVAFLAISRVWTLRGKAIRAVFDDPADRFALTVAATLILLTLSGTARGETGRVWLFFAPCWILLAADWLAHASQRPTTTWIAGILPLQAICLVCMAAVLRVQFTALTVPPDPPAADPPMYAVNAQFASGADRFTLTGLSVNQNADHVTLLLHWRADGFVAHPYVFSLVTTPPDHKDRPSVNWAPAHWEYPTTCWTPNREFVDAVSVPITDPSSAAPIRGDWLFSLSASDALTHDPIAADGQPQVGIGPVHVP